jgi:PAS domain S-box-containing protein
MARANQSESVSSKLFGLPLRYRLSIPFFFLAFLGTFSLVGLAILSQNQLISKEEDERLHGYNRALHHNLQLQGRWAVSLASSFARNPEVAEAMAAKDRMLLIRICYPWYLFMKEHYGISQFNFHTLPPRNLVRFQRLYEFGDSLSYRHTILDAVSRETETFGLERGLTGYGIRGVAPIFFQNRMVGVVEIGFNFGSVFLDEMKKQFDIEASFFLPDDNQSSFVSFATTFPEPVKRTESEYAKVFEKGGQEVLQKEISGTPYTILVGTVKDYQGETVALIEFCMKRADTLRLAAQYRELMLGLGILGMILSVGAIYAISKYFTEPIGKMVSYAQNIASGGEFTPLGIYPQGELGILADALDHMFASLQESREQVRLYTVNLETMVQQRTQALRESEEKYRTLVENVPLVVYRLQADGQTIFINQFIEELAGVPPQQALATPGFWKDKVCPEDRPRIWPFMDRCLREGIEFAAEYRIQRLSGEFIFVLDHALPAQDEQGRVYSVDGFLVNITDRRQLQEQIIQTEELRTLSEVSARLAHEIRNPLVAAGGFARRIVLKLPEDDPLRKKAQIIVKEVTRLEKILEQMLVYLKPFDVVLETCSLNDLIMQVLEEQKETLNELAISLKVNLSARLPFLHLDKVLINKAFASILVGLLELCQPEKTLEVQTSPCEHSAHLQFSVTGAQVSKDDLEHFFYPFASRADRPKMMELPMAKMIIHKHQGLVDVEQKDPNTLVVSISLPLA